MITTFQLGDPIELRLKEEEQRGESIAQLTFCITSFKNAALSADPRYEHIEPSEKAKVCHRKLILLRMCSQI